MTRILMVDDQALVRAGFETILTSEPGFDVIGQARNGAEGVRLATELQPDVICMDVQMPVMDGLDATRAITAADGHAAVLMLTTFDRDDFLFEALSAGASGFLLKTAEPEQLIDAVHALARGDALLSPEVTRRVIERFAATPAAAPAAGRGAAEGGVTRPPRGRSRRPRAAHRARARDAAAARSRALERGDRSRAVRRRGDGEDARVERAAEARRPRPHPRGDLGVRARGGGASWLRARALRRRARCRTRRRGGTRRRALRRGARCSRWCGSCSPAWDWWARGGSTSPSSSTQAGSAISRAGSRTRRAPRRRSTCWSWRRPARSSCSSRARLGWGRWVWVLVVLSGITAIAFTFPLFLGLRELALRRRAREHS